MNNWRSVFVRFIPVVFLGTLLTVLINLLVKVYMPYENHFQPWYYAAFTNVLRHGALWTAIALATRQIKAAATALIVAILILAFNILIDHQPVISSLTASCLLDIFANVVFLPALIFLVICFKKQALQYILPLCVLAFGFPMLNAGSEYLAGAPYNAWFHALGIDELLKVNRTEHSHIEIDLFWHIYYLIEPGVIFLLIAEFYIAAVSHKKLKEGLTVNTATRFTKTGTIVQFLIERAAINLLVMGLIYHPRIWWLPQMNSFSFLAFTFLLAIVCSIALLAATFFHYRKFIIEYFISHNRKTSGLFWIVNIPVIGLFVFPWLVLGKEPLEEEAAPAPTL